MSAIYDNWERLVAAVIKKQQLWELFHEQSRSPSILSESSDFTASSLHDLDFDFSNLEISSKSQIWPPSNLVLISDFCPAMNFKDDAALAKLMNPEKLSPDYCAPEVENSRKVSQASDVYGFGVVLLELVSGRPSQDLAEWIRSVDRSYWIPEVLDIKLLGYGNDQQELMMKLLQIAVDCVSIVPKHRPTIFEVVRVLEEISGFEPGTILELSSEINGLESQSIFEESSVQSALEYLLEDLLPHLSP